MDRLSLYNLNHLFGGIITSSFVRVGGKTPTSTLYTLRARLWQVAKDGKLRHLKCKDLMNAFNWSEAEPVGSDNSGDYWKDWYKLTKENFNGAYGETYKPLALLGHHEIPPGQCGKFLIRPAKYDESFQFTDNRVIEIKQSLIATLGPVIFGEWSNVEAETASEQELI